MGVNSIASLLPPSVLVSSCVRCQNGGKLLSKILVL